MEAGPGKTGIAITTAPTQSDGPLTFSLDSVCASIQAETRFTFDPGPSPQPGQVWDLNQNITLGNGYSLLVSKVKYDLTDGVQAFLGFEMLSTEPGMAYVFLVDEAHLLTMTAGGGGSCYAPGPFTAELYYLEPLPQGPLTVTITGFMVNLSGHWEVVWTPPANQP
jgi:hypothetical protein